MLGAAVVGGVALAHNAQSENRTNRTSSVVIEELNDAADDGAGNEEDDWVAVSNTDE